MDSALVVLTLTLGALLLALWVVHLRRDLARRAGRSQEWAGGNADPQVWTSQVRCLECHATGALMSREGGRLWHTCMACGARHERQHRA